MAEAVMVAVRCRPFNKRETQMESKCIVQMSGAKTTLVDPTASTPPRDFTFDYSYWSFDSSAANFATNPKVYSDLGVSVLNNAWGGYNCCLFAYGQTGSGKSYSMIGYGEDKGIVPQAMEEMFNRISKNKDKNIKYMVEASMMEIYNEKVRDLFNPDSEKSNIHGLKIRDSPQTGPYVEDLAKCPVKSYEEFSRLLDEGTAVRTVAATQMNATSSRAHTVFQIVFTKTTHDEETGKSSAVTSKINLVDLAGSERVSKTGASGQQLKEGIGINKSLTALGNVIEKLAKKSNAASGGGKKGAAGAAAKEVHVPYRDSVLTWLLKNALGGNAKTIMIAAISPSDDNYDESLSTLRYADRAKQIKNSAVINEDENGRMIRALKAEIQALKDAIANGTVGGVGGGMKDHSTMSDKERSEYLSLKQQMSQNEELVRKMNMSWEEKIKESEELAFKRAQALNFNASEQESKKKRLPHMVNLHKDKLMSNCLSYFFPPAPKTVRLCTKLINPPPTEDDIILSGLQIKTDHGVAENVLADPKSKDSIGIVYITPSDGARIFINGKLIKSRTELAHNDRIILGAHLVFRMIYPNHASDDGEGEDGESIYDWEFANKEMTHQTIDSLNKNSSEEQQAQQKQQEEQTARLKDMQEQIEAEKKRAKEEQLRKQSEYEQTLRDIARKKEEEIAQTKAAIELAVSTENQRELQKKLQEREMELEKERAVAAKKHSDRLEEMKKQQHILEEKLTAQKKETALLHKRHENEKRDRHLLEENLIHIIPMINEANGICTELSQALRFSIKLEAKRSQDEDAFTERTDVWVRVLNLEDDSEVIWSMETLSEVLYQMREIYNYFLRSGEVHIPQKKEENPFYFESSGLQLIGTSRVYLQPNFFLLPINESISIIDYRGEHKGQVYINMIPIPPRTEETKDLREEELFFEEEELSELKGEPLSIRLEIKKCMGLPGKFARNVYVTYRFFYDSQEQQTEVCKDETINPMLNYTRTLAIECIEDELIEYVKNGIMEFSVWGEQQENQEHDEEEEKEETKDAHSHGSGHVIINSNQSKLQQMKAASSKRSSMKDMSSSGSKRGSVTVAATTARLTKLESVLQHITQTIDPDNPLSPEERVKEKPEEIGKKVEELKEDYTKLKSPTSVPPTITTVGNVDLQAENEKIRAEFASFKRKAVIPGDSSSSSNSTPEDLAALLAAKSAHEEALKKGEAELLSLRKKYAEKEEKEAEEMKILKQSEEELKQQLDQALESKKVRKQHGSTPSQALLSEKEVLKLQSDLASARQKIHVKQSEHDANLQKTIEEKDQELENLRKQLKLANEKKSSTCVIL